MTGWNLHSMSFYNYSNFRVFFKVATIEQSFMYSHPATPNVNILHSHSTITKTRTLTFYDNIN